MKKSAISTLKLLPLVVAMLAAIPSLSAQEPPAAGEQEIHIFLPEEAPPAEEAENKDKPMFVKLVEQHAKFEDGDLEMFRRWVMQQLVYPEDAAEQGIQGNVYAQFVVSKEGKVEQVKLLRGLGWKSIDDEVLRVLKQSPAWTPGEHRGKKVDIVYVMPVSFKLSN